MGFAISCQRLGEPCAEQRELELLPDGELSTKWQSGTWCVDDHPLILELTFGASCHVCRLDVDKGKFLVEKRVRGREGQIAQGPKIKGQEVVTAGWPIDSIALQDKQRRCPPVEHGAKAKLKAVEAAEEKKKVAEEAA